VLDRRLREEDVAIQVGAAVERVERLRSGVSAVVGGRRLEGDAILVATGRRPAVEDLGLEHAGVQHGRGGIQVDARLRTSQRHICAAGDVTGSFQFTHYAGWQGFVAARNALFPRDQRGLRSTVPWAVFTDPEVAQVGLTEEDARKQDLKVEAHRRPLECVDRAQTTGATEGLIKVVTQPNGKLLGAALAGPAASELCNEFSLALEKRLRISDLSRAIHVYPTYGSGIQQLAADVSLRQALSGWRGHLVRLLRHRRG
jgi:pyruvate/2-oxoglutarate dehydrogenase complex dihydrolipoamide dehydrogenase (E3) component